MDRESIEASIVSSQPRDYAELCGVIYVAYGTGRKKNNISLWGDKNNFYLNHQPLNTIIRLSVIILTEPGLLETVHFLIAMNMELKVHLLWCVV